MAGGPKERTVTVKLGDDLFRKSNERAIYAEGYVVQEIDAFLQSNAGSSS